MQDWTIIETGLHRALASYVHRRLLQNAGTRRETRLYQMLPNCTCVCERPGHDRMAVLKGIVKMVRGEAGYICIYIWVTIYPQNLDIIWHLQ